MTEPPLTLPHYSFWSTALGSYLKFCKCVSSKLLDAYININQNYLPFLLEIHKTTIMQKHWFFFSISYSALWPWTVRWNLLKQLEFAEKISTSKNPKFPSLHRVSSAQIFRRFDGKIAKLSICIGDAEDCSPISFRCIGSASNSPNPIDNETSLCAASAVGCLVHRVASHLNFHNGGP